MMNKHHANTVVMCCFIRSLPVGCETRGNTHVDVYVSTGMYLYASETHER